MKYLIVVDMQNDFIDGTLGTPEAKAIVPKVVEKIIGFEGKICVTLDTHNSEYLTTQEGKNLPVVHCVEYTEGWKLSSLISDAFEEHPTATAPFIKNTFGSIELMDWMLKEESRNKIDEIILVGLCTDICVISNAMLLKAALPEVKIVVDASCCAGVTPETHENALKAMQQCQVNIIHEECLV